MKDAILEKYARCGFLRDLLFNNIMSGKDIQNLQKRMDIPTPPNAVMVVSVDNYLSIIRNTSETQKKRLRLGILKSVEEVAAKFNGVGINIEENLYAVLFHANSSEIEPLIHLANTLRDYVETETGVSVSVGIGRRCKDILDLHLSYKDALKACCHKFFGKSRVIHIDNIVPFYNELGLFLIELETQLSVKMLSCDKKGAFKILDEFFADWFEKKCINPIIVKARLIEVIINIIKVGLEAGVKQERLALSSSRFVEKVLKSDTILDLRNHMKEVVSFVIFEISRYRRRMNLDVFEKAVKYINENYSKRLSLTDVSERMHMSPYHFSHGFKKFTGMSFIEYLTRIRIREAKKLLLTTDLNISAVSKRVGYDDPNYFGRVFKKIEGIPPSEFKVSKNNDYML